MPKLPQREGDDLVDSGTVSDAPHDRGHVNTDGDYEDAVDDMVRAIKDSPKARREGLTQNEPPKKT